MSARNYAFLLRLLRLQLESYHQGLLPNQNLGKANDWMAVMSFTAWDVSIRVGYHSQNYQAMISGKGSPQYGSVMTPKYARLFAEGIGRIMPAWVVMQMGVFAGSLFFVVPWVECPSNEASQTEASKAVPRV